MPASRLVTTGLALLEFTRRIRSFASPFVYASLKSFLDYTIPPRASEHVDAKFPETFVEPDRDQRLPLGLRVGSIVQVGGEGTKEQEASSKK